MLQPFLVPNVLEAGCDEAGRGCLAGSVYAAAVVFPPDYNNEEINDSKQLTDVRRHELRKTIERDALAWAVGVVTSQEIDKINILNASILAMHRALEQLRVTPQSIIVDGNRFKPYRDVPWQTVVKGDGKFLSIAAASILAKTYRDDYMDMIDKDYPVYGWKRNKGYPTKEHREAIRKYGHALVTERHSTSCLPYNLNCLTDELR